MRRAAQWMWRLFPADYRHRLFQSIVKSKNPFIVFAIRMGKKVTLYNHRWTVHAYWPEARGIDFSALTLWSIFLKFHESGLSLMWRRGYRMRSYFTPRPVDPANRVVAHATGSFDLGGTQTQIKNLCTAPEARYRHDAVEIFPELNYLYRRDVIVDPAFYVRGGTITRMLGRLVLNRNYRSSQLVQIYKLVRDFNAIKPDVVVGWGHEMSVTTFIAGAIARIPHIIFCIRTVNPTYGWVDPPFPDLLLRAHLCMLPKVSKVIVNSTLLQDDYSKWAAIDRESIVVCANGISASPLPPDRAAAARASVREAFGIGAGVRVILNVGRFSNEKGQRTLVEANKLLLDRGTAPPFVFLMCGDGITLEEVKAKAAGYGMTNMLFPGRTDRVKDVLAAADIFVMPSDYEGMPNAMMEAMAAGLPCVSTTRSGALDVARPGLDALYYEPRNATQLAIHLERLLQDPEYARNLGGAAAARILEFSVARSVTTFEQILDTVRSSPPPS
jgi:glycosyltransferase involved in cell wall biosynthesis